jgi:hypothetical protein
MHRILSCLSMTLFLTVLILSSFTQAAEIRLVWDPNTEPDLAGYMLYYGPVSGEYGTPIDVGNVTTHTLTGLIQGQIYYLNFASGYEIGLRNSGLTI